MLSMDIPTDQLPSKGLLYPFSTLAVSRLKFSQIMEYSADLSYCQNELSRFLVQLKHLILNLPAGREVSMYDAIALIAIRTYMSTSADLTNNIRIKYQCPIHNKKEVIEVDLRSIRFEDIDEELVRVDTFRLGGKSYRFRIPTVAEFVDVAEHFKTSLPMNDLLATKYIWILSMFKDIMDKDKRMEILSAVKNATADDDGILVLNTLYKKLSGAFQYLVAYCDQGGEKVMVKIPTVEPITQYFLDLPILSKLDGNFFTFK